MWATAPPTTGHIWINDDGKLYYGAIRIPPKTIGSASAYKDGTWHYVVATLSTAGEILYVDGQQVGIDATTTTAWPNYTTPYWRVGQDNLNSWVRRLPEIGISTVPLMK